MELGFKYPSLSMRSRGVATQGLNPDPKWFEPTRAYGNVAAERHHSALSTSAIPHVGMGPDFELRAGPETNLVPDPPTRSTICHNDGWWHQLRAREMDEPREKPARQMVMELRFKYPSLSMQSRGVATQGLNPDPNGLNLPGHAAQ